MEFKGTSGLWEFDKYCVSTKEEVMGNIICESPSWSEASNANWKANAKLISKAPEMLEMLKDILDSNQLDEHFLYMEIETLIEEATKID